MLMGCRYGPTGPGKSRRPMNGMTLVEVMVGLLIGLLISGIALNALQISRTLSQITSEATALQQDANTAMRIMGRQVRQAGSVSLNLQPDVFEATALETWAPGQIPVLFEPTVENSTDAAAGSSRLPAMAAPVVAKSTGDTLLTRHENHGENLYRSSTGTVWGSQDVDCLGQNTSKQSLTSTISSTFFVREEQLMCAGVAGTPQPMIGNVKDFTVRFLAENTSVASVKIESASSLSYMAADALNSGSPAGWQDVRAVEICLELESPLAKAPDIGMAYRKCNGEWQSRRNRLVFVARSLFQVRPQGS